LRCWMPPGRAWQSGAPFVFDVDGPRCPIRVGGQGACLLSGHGGAAAPEPRVRGVKSVHWACTARAPAGRVDRHAGGAVRGGAARGGGMVRGTGRRPGLADLLRSIALSEAVADWSRTGPERRRTKIGARVVRHARDITFQLAEVAVTGPMVRAILAAISRGRPPPVCA